MIPEVVLKAMLSVAILLRWEKFAAVVAMGFTMLVNGNDESIVDEYSVGIEVRLLRHPRRFSP